MQYSKSFIDELTSAYTSGDSLNTLSRKHGIPKSSLHYQLTKRNVVRRVHSVTRLLSNDELYLGIFIGLWAGDGNRANNRHNYGYSVRFFFNKKDGLAILLLYKTSQVLFGVKPGIVDEKPHLFAYQLVSKFIFIF